MSKDVKYYLGLDNGGTNTKAAIFSEDGQEISVVSTETKMITPRPNFTERDMDEMWEANCSVIRQALLQANLQPSQIAGIACCGHGKGLYLWGKNNRPARNGIISSDNRAYEYPQRWKQLGIAEKLHKLTYQNILACQPVSLLAWLIDHEPQSIENAEWIFECKDYVRFRLTGQAGAEITDYSGTNLVNLNTQQYDNEILQLLGLECIADKLPPLCQSNDICGYITEEAAKQTGLTPGTPVAGGMFDIDACAIAVDAAKEDRLCMIAGTWSINEYIRKNPVTDGSVELNSIFCMPDYYLIEESSPTSAGNNEWFIQTLLPELKEMLKIDGENIYSFMNQAVDTISPQEFCPIFTPFLMGSNVHPNAKASFVGISNYHTRAHIMRGIYEGITFCHKYHFDKLMSTRDLPLSSIQLAGGAAKSKVWAQMFADILGYPVNVVDINETGALGCAMAAAVAIGQYADYAAAAKAMLRTSETLLPRAEYAEIYAKKYSIYKSILCSLNNVWDQIKELM